jgi:hypothetical protein
MNNSLAQLLALNREVAAKIERDEPVTAPGVPSGFPDPESLVTGDCIVPPGEYAETIPHPDSTPESEALAAHFYFTKEEGPPYRTN